MSDLVERLRLAAEKSSTIQRGMAEAKSLRQESNAARRIDLYSWPEPDATLEGRAADRISTLESQVSALREALESREPEPDVALCTWDVAGPWWMRRSRRLEIAIRTSLRTALVPLPLLPAEPSNIKGDGRHD